MSNLVEYILESYTVESNIGMFGTKLLKAITDKTNVDLPENDEISESIKYLKSLDANQDLLWIDWYSWNNLPLQARKDISSAITIISLQAVYMSYKGFISAIEILKKYTHGFVYYVLKTGNCYRIVILGGAMDSIYERDSKYLKVLSDIVKESTINKFSIHNGDIIEG